MCFFQHFSAAHTQPQAKGPAQLPSITSPPRHCPPPQKGHQRPTAGTTPVTASPGGDHASPRKLWHRSPAPRLARQKKSPLCATIARLSPPEPPGPVPPAPGLPHALGPMKGPTVAIRVAGGGWGEDRAAAGTPTPAPRGAWWQVWGYCPGGATGGGYLKAEPVLPWGWQGKGGTRSPRTCLSGGDPAPQGRASSGARGVRQEPAPYPGPGTAPRSPGSLLLQGGLEQAKPRTTPDPMARAGSVPAVTAVSFQPLCDDARPGCPPPFPSSSFALQLPLSQAQPLEPP